MHNKCTIILISFSNQLFVETNLRIFVYRQESLTLCARWDFHYFLSIEFMLNHEFSPPIRVQDSYIVRKSECLDFTFKQIRMVLTALHIATPLRNNP